MVTGAPGLRLSGLCLPSHSFISSKLPKMKQRFCELFKEDSFGFVAKVCIISADFKFTSIIYLMMIEVTDTV